LKVTPVMLNVDLPVSLNVSLSWSPLSRLMPLNEASWRVVVICDRILLYCDTRLLRTGLRRGVEHRSRAVEKVSELVTVTDDAARATVPSVEDAQSLVEEIDSLPSSRASRPGCWQSWAFQLIERLDRACVPAPSDIDRRTAVKEVKVKVLPLMPPAPAVRAAAKLVALLVAPVRPAPRAHCRRGDRQIGGGAVLS